MKDGIHPHYVETVVVCGCGSSFKTRSTKKDLKVDICSNCHPFYTGKLKYVDTAGRIERFQNKFASVGYSSVKRGKKKAAEAAAAAGEAPKQGKSLGERLRGAAKTIRGGQKKQDAGAKSKASKPARGGAKKTTTPRKAGGS